MLLLGEGQLAGLGTMLLLGEGQLAGLGTMLLLGEGQARDHAIIRWLGTMLLGAMLLLRRYVIIRQSCGESGNTYDTA
jgi:hypothetical protein